MNKNNFKMVEFPSSTFLCGETLLSYVKSNLSVDKNYVLVVKYISLYQSMVLKSNKSLDYNYLSSNYDRIIIGFYDSCFKLRLENIVSKVGCSKKELESDKDFFIVVSDINMKNPIEELLFSPAVLRTDDGDDCCYNYYDYDILGLDDDNITMYFIPVDNYTDEVLDNIINRYDIKV